MSWQEKVKNKLPNLTVGQFWWVQGNILIDDIGLEELELSADIPALQVSTDVLTPATLNALLLKVFQLELFPMMIWPGEGAKVVQKSLGWPGGMHVAARRIGYENPVASVADFQAPKGKVAVIDDVISSGATAFEVWRKGQFKDASLAAWIMQSPRDANLRCYQKIFVGLIVKGNRGKVPINSLSTFLENSAVLDDYALRYARNREECKAFFTWLKKEGVRRAL